MVFSNFLENLLGDPVKIRVYRVLTRRAEGVTGRGIASLIGTSPFKINQVLRGLVSDGVVESVSMGRANLYRLNRRHVLVRDLVFFLTDYEKGFWLNLGRKILKHLRPKPLSVILYGSVARGEEEATSDLDLHLVYDDRISEKEGGDQDRLLREEMGRAYGNPLSITRSTVSEFQRRSRQREPLIRNIVKEGRVLAGKSFTELLSHDRKTD
jgi:predicted nucleotidyltransferase